MSITFKSVEKGKYIINIFFLLLIEHLIYDLYIFLLINIYFSILNNTQNEFY